MKLDPICLDLFAGTGWGVALRNLGIQEIAIDNMPAVLATRRANNLVTWPEDVWNVRYEDFAGDIDLLLASPPCQTFSRAGLGAGKQHLDEVSRLIEAILFGRITTMQELKQATSHFDPRTGLILVPLLASLIVRPRAIAWEQVPAVAPVWEACAVVLRANGYTVWTGFLDAETYGVPQTRHRAVLIARRDDKHAAPPPRTHSRYYSRDPQRLDQGVEKWVSMAEALQWTQPFRVVSNYGTGGDPKNRGIREGDQPAATVTSKAGRNRVEEFTHFGDVINSKGAIRRADQPAPSMTASMDNGNFRFIDATADLSENVERRVRDRLNDQTGTPFDAQWPLKRPALTVAGRGLMPHPGRNANAINGSTKSRNDGVRITPEEAAILQSYPADFVFVGTKEEKYTQIGNAVPVRMAEAILREIAV